LHEFFKLPKDERQALTKVMVESDAWQHLFTETELIAKGMNERQRIAYYAWKRTMDNAWATLVDHTQGMILKPYEGKDYYNNLKAFIEGKTDWARRYEEPILRMHMENTVEAKDALRNGRIDRKTHDEIIATEQAGRASSEK